ncbi:alanine racemase, partial [bacterium]|nr:alanine racemase [bacterium]
VLGGVWGNQVPLFLKHSLTITASSIDKIKMIDETAEQMKVKAVVHLKIDTGMGRIGVSVSSVFKLIEEISLLPGVVLEGISSHLSCADTDKEFTKKQINDFASIVEKIKEKKIRYSHIANSAAVLCFPESYFDLVRPGLILYGLIPCADALNKIKLKPVMSLKTKIVFLKKVLKGTPISYGKTYITKKTTRIATLPIGYADGYNRLLSNNAQVLIKGKRLPIVGRVCMDMCMVDVNDLPQAAVGDEVVLIGNQKGEMITAEEVASWSKTINYEVVCGLSKRIPRIYTGNVK